MQGIFVSKKIKQTIMLTQFLISSTLQKTPQQRPPFLLLQPVQPVQSEEERLLTAVTAGDQQAMAVLIKRHQKMVLSIAMDVTGNRADAEEAAQDTFVKAFRFLPNFRRESSFKTWLRRIARTTALNQLRVKGLPSVSLDAPESSPVYFLQEKGDDALQLLLRDERARLVKTAIQRLSKEDATALRLFYFHEKSLEEISEATGWTVNNAKSRLSRARQRLRAVLERGNGL
jgi:RNA polymerase sigma-70 factor (ECF subfamily)